MTNSNIINFSDLVREKYVNDISNIFAGWITMLAELFIDYVVRPVIAASATIAQKKVVVL